MARTSGDGPGAWKYALLLRFAELWLASCRPVILGKDAVRPLLDSGRPVISALWHASLIYSLFHCKTYPAVIMVSGSSDGEWVARILERWGQIPVRGSRLKGGLQAVRKMVGLMRQHGYNAGIVADGSTGPALVVQKGAIVLARDSGAPVIPLGFAARPAYRFNNWDRTILPCPFGRVVMVYGKPIWVPQDAKGTVIEKYRKMLEASLNEATRRAAKEAGIKKM